MMKSLGVGFYVTNKNCHILKFVQVDDLSQKMSDKYLQHINSLQSAIDWISTMKMTSLCSIYLLSKVITGTLNSELLTNIFAVLST